MLVILNVCYDTKPFNHIDGVMVSVLASSVVDYGFIGGVMVNGRLWVRAPVESNQRLKVVSVDSLLSTQH